MSHPHRDWSLRIDVDPTAFIAPGAVVVGQVSLGARSSVWFNSVLRGDIAPVVIGDETNIQDNSVVHVDEGLPAVIGSRVTVGHRAIVHGCVIEDECLIGMGAVVLSGARVGRGSLVGAAALVLEHQEVPPGSLVLGAPGRIAGSAEDTHRQAIRDAATHYVELARCYLDRGLGTSDPVGALIRGGSREPEGAVSPAEWSRMLGILGEGPPRAAELMRSVGPERWLRRSGALGSSAHDLLLEMAAAERWEYLPSLERHLAKLPSRSDSGSGEDALDRDPGATAVLEAWAHDRRRLVELLARIAATDQWFEARGGGGADSLACFIHEGHRSEGEGWFQRRKRVGEVAPGLSPSSR